MYKFSFLEMMKQYKSMRDGHHGWTTETRQQIVQNQPGSFSTRTGPYCTGSKHREFESKKINKIQEAGVVGTCVTS